MCFHSTMSTRVSLGMRKFLEKIMCSFCFFVRRYSFLLAFKRFPFRAFSLSAHESLEVAWRVFPPAERMDVVNSPPRNEKMKRIRSDIPKVFCRPTHQTEDMD